MIFHDGGEGGIRTHGGRKPTPVFETGALIHYATSPHALRLTSTARFRQPFSSIFKELLHQCATLIFKYTRLDLDPVIQKVSVANPKARRHRTCALVRRSINQTSYPRLDQRPSTHCTRLDRRVDIHVCQPVIAYRLGGFAKGNDFSMGGGVAVSTGPISSDCDEGISADHTSADWHFAALLRLMCGVECVPHPAFLQLHFRGRRHKLQFLQITGRSI